MPGYGFGSAGIFEGVFVVFFVLFAIVVFFIIFKGITGYAKNESSPELSVAAKVVAKRTYNHDDFRSQYYVTFEVESGDRMELRLNDHEFAMLAENDMGMLTFQGTRFLGFERKR